MCSFVAPLLLTGRSHNVAAAGQMSIEELMAEARNVSDLATVARSSKPRSSAVPSMPHIGERAEFVWTHWKGWTSTRLAPSLPGSEGSLISGFAPRPKQLSNSGEDSSAARRSLLQNAALLGSSPSIRRNPSIRRDALAMVRRLLCPQPSLWLTSSSRCRPDRGRCRIRRLPLPTLCSGSSLARHTAGE